MNFFSDPVKGILLVIYKDQTWNKNTQTFSKQTSKTSDWIKWIHSRNSFRLSQHHCILNEQPRLVNCEISWLKIRVRCFKVSQCNVVINQFIFTTLKKPKPFGSSQVLGFGFLGWLLFVSCLVSSSGSALCVVRDLNPESCQDLEPQIQFNWLQVHNCSLW